MAESFLNTNLEKSVLKGFFNEKNYDSISVKGPAWKQGNNNFSPPFQTPYDIFTEIIFK